MTTVPSDVACIEIVVEQSGRRFVRRFTVTVGVPAELRLGGLPLGDVAFSAAAFSSSCLDPPAPPSWQSDVVTIVLKLGEVAVVRLTLRRPGRAIVEVGFEDDAAETSAPPDAAPVDVPEDLPVEIPGEEPDAGAADGAIDTGGPNCTLNFPCGPETPCCQTGGYPPQQCIGGSCFSCGPEGGRCGGAPGVQCCPGLICRPSGEGLTLRCFSTPAGIGDPCNPTRPGSCGTAFCEGEALLGRCCVTQSGSCTQDSDCCRGRDPAGRAKCDPDTKTCCLVAGESYGGLARCCSGSHHVNREDRCAAGCASPGALCFDDKNCCPGGARCSQNSCCFAAGEPCGDPNACCAGTTCDPGTRTCVTGCGTPGDLCSDGTCCAGGRCEFPTRRCTFN